MGKEPLTCYSIDFADRRHLFTRRRQTPRQPDHPTINNLITGWALT